MSKRPMNHSASSASDSLGRAGALTDSRFLLRIDGSFEALLGLLLILSPATGLYTALDLPVPATKLVVVIAGLLLIPLLPILWRASRASRREFVLALAAANGTGAVVFGLWVLIWNRTFHPAGAAFVLVVAGILAILGALQARTAFVAA
jgi:hypothetical protein